MNIQLDDVDDDILNSLAVEHDNFRVSNRPYLLTARSLLSLLIIIVIYATQAAPSHTQAAHTHTTAYTHTDTHTHTGSPHTRNSIHTHRHTHTHTTAYNHIHQHAQNYMLRSIKNTEKD